MLPTRPVLSGPDESLAPELVDHDGDLLLIEPMRIAVGGDGAVAILCRWTPVLGRDEATRLGQCLRILAGTLLRHGRRRLLLNRPGSATTTADERAIAALIRTACIRPDRHERLLEWLLPAEGRGQAAAAAARIAGCYAAAGLIDPVGELVADMEAAAAFAATPAPDRAMAALGA